MAEPRLEGKRVTDLTNAIVKIYQAADQKLALVDTLINSDVGEKLNNTIAAHGFNRLLHTVYLDTIKDLWAITLDTNSRSPSIFTLKKLLDAAGTRKALRHAYGDPLESKLIADSIDPGPVRELSRENRRRENELEFDSRLDTVLSDINDVLSDPRLQKLKEVRHQIISHYSFKERQGKSELVQIDSFKVYWHDAEEIFVKLDPLLTNASIIFSGIQFVAGIRGKALHREWMTAFWNAVRNLGQSSGPGGEHGK